MMKGNINLLIFLLAFLGFIACKDKKISNNTFNENKGNSTQFLSIVESYNRFAFNLFQYSPYQTKNTIISPMSAAISLTALYNGTTNQAQEEISRVMRYYVTKDTLNKDFSYLMNLMNHYKDSGIKFSTDMSFWHEKSHKFNRVFVDIINHRYGNLFHSFDALLQNNLNVEINKWIQGISPDFIFNIGESNSLNEEEMLVLNVVTIESLWQNTFNSEQGFMANFYYDNPSESRNVPFMRKIDSLYYRSNNAMLFIELPFKDNKLSFVAIVPRFHSEFRKVENNVTYDAYKRMTYPPRKEKTHVIIPRFTFSNNFSLKQTLKGMGINSIFQDSAFPTSENRSLKIKDFHQYIEIKVDENGIDTMPVVEDVFNELLSGRVEQEVILDRPFIFFIKENRYNMILLIGRIFEPIPIV
ncbi:MAG: serpin family protein [Bacteroidales bacterium]|nr:serpin family protein [Bacteroidales bacterium]